MAGADLANIDRRWMKPVAPGGGGGGGRGGSGVCGPVSTEIDGYFIILFRGEFLVDTHSNLPRKQVCQVSKRAR